MFCSYDGSVTWNGNLQWFQTEQDSLLFIIRYQNTTAGDNTAYSYISLHCGKCLQFTISCLCHFTITKCKDNGIKQTVVIFFLSCQKNVFPDPSKSCGPYKPGAALTQLKRTRHANVHSHDTIGRFFLLICNVKSALLRFSI